MTIFTNKLEACNTLWGRAFTRDLDWFLLTIMKGYNDKLS